jgi:aldehyde dehydrogenase (NAD+)
MSDKQNRTVQLFEIQESNQFRVASTTWKERIKKLHLLQNALEKTYRRDIRKALSDDFGIPALETDLTEIYLVLKEIKQAKNHLSRWMAPHKTRTPGALQGTRSWWQYEPKGVCLVISPWNFPVNLSFGPLVSAIAAGNTVILKPSEKTAHTSTLIRNIVEALYPENEVAVVEGGAEISRSLLELPFNHIFFTGSPRIGKLVMKAAAENLASVTLELGGKSPAIIDETADLKNAARRIAWGKFLNAGQICISPDYVLVKENIKEAFLSLIKEQLDKFYTANPMQSGDYPRIVDVEHFRGLRDLFEDSLVRGASCELGGDFQENTRYISPTLLTGVSLDSAIMKQEIFGPILPLVTYKTTDEAIRHINSGEKPLALYIFSGERSTIAHILNQTRAGSSCINTNLLQYTNPNLPFGGVNNSGMGKSHGFHGFREFSNQRAVLSQYLPTPMELLFPPYTNFKQKLADFTLKWL